MATRKSIPTDEYPKALEDEEVEILSQDDSSKQPPLDIVTFNELDILLSVIAGTGAFVVATALGSVVTTMLAGGPPTVIAGVTGIFFVPYFLCGLMLGFTCGFSFPRVLAPICAFWALNVLTLFIRDFNYVHVLEDPWYFLPIIAIFFALAGVLLSERIERFRDRRQANRG